MTDVKWLDEPEDHDYPAAEDYLSLVLSGDVAKDCVHDLKQAQVTTRKAKDILRASGLPLLSKTQIAVLKDTNKIKAGKALSPVLLVVGKQILHIADGYHRVCAIYWVDPDLDVRCKLV